MTNKKEIVEELLDCVADATDTETQITNLTLAGILMNEVLDEVLTIPDVVSNKNHLSKDEILSTGDWDEGDYANMMEGYLWKHKSMGKDDYVIYMRRYKNDGYTTIEEQGKEENKLFEGYINNIEELNQIIHLCRLHS